MTRLIRTAGFLLVLCIGAGSLCGCLSRRASHNLGYAVTERIFGKLMDIPFWTDAFREDKGRLPRDYAELSNYVLRETDSRVKLDPYSRIDFSILPSGERQAECYSLAGVKSVVRWGEPKK